MMRKLGPKIKVPIHVYGPETHITAIVPLALGVALDESMKMESKMLREEYEKLSHCAVISPSSRGGALSPTAAPPASSPVPLQQSPLAAGAAAAGAGAAASPGSTCLC